MGETMRLLVFGVATVLSVAAADAQVYQGNDTGGIISWSCENEAARVTGSLAQANTRSQSGSAAGRKGSWPCR